MDPWGRGYPPGLRTQGRGFDSRWVRFCDFYFLISGKKTLSRGELSPLILCRRYAGDEMTIFKIFLSRLCRDLLDSYLWREGLPPKFPLHDKIEDGGTLSCALISPSPPDLRPAETEAVSEMKRRRRMSLIEPPARPIWECCWFTRVPGTGKGFYRTQILNWGGPTPSKEISPLDIYTIYSSLMYVLSSIST